MIGRVFDRKVIRWVWWAVAALVAVVAILVYAPTGTWAERMLELFRIKRVSVVAIDMEGLEGQAEQLAQLIADDLVITREPEERMEVSSIEEAGESAGFQVRSLGGQVPAARVWVQSGIACQMTVNLSKVQEVLAELGRTDIQLPTSLDGATVTIDVPKSVIARYEVRSSADPWSSSFMLYQAPTPTVVIPAGLSLAEIAAAGLQLAGWSAEQARAFSQTVDWTSTLVVPIPARVTSHQTVDVDGVKGTLITENRADRRPSKFLLLWVKQGIIYAIAGYGEPADALSLAASLE